MVTNQCETLQEYRDALALDLQLLEEDPLAFVARQSEERRKTVEDLLLARPETTDESQELQDWRKWFAGHYRYMLKLTLSSELERCEKLLVNLE